MVQKLLPYVLLGLLATGCGVHMDDRIDLHGIHRVLPLRAIEVRVVTVPGGLFSSESYSYELKNVSGKQLTEVTLTVTRRDNANRQQADTVYWAFWPAGEERVACVSKSGETHPARVDISGKTKEGEYDCYVLVPGH